MKVGRSFNKEEEVKTFDYIREAIRPYELGLEGPAEAPFWKEGEM